MEYLVVSSFDHHIQKKIFEKLLYVDNLRYSELRPDGVESNHFSYHLKQLLKSGMIEKNGNQYSLSAKGKAHVDRLSLSSLKVRLQPKLITLLHISCGDKVLFQKRKHQPYINMYGLPSGKQHFGEMIEEAAQREVQENLLIKNLPLKHRGILNIAISEDNQIISSITAHIFSGKVKQTTDEWEDHKAVRVFAKPSSINANEFIPGFKETQKHLKNKEFFFGEYLFNL